MRAAFQAFCLLKSKVMQVGLILGCYFLVDILPIGQSRTLAANIRPCQWDGRKIRPILLPRGQCIDDYPDLALLSVLKLYQVYLSEFIG